MSPPFLNPFKVTGSGSSEGNLLFTSVFVLFSESFFALCPPGMECPVAEWHIPACLCLALLDGVSLEAVPHSAEPFPAPSAAEGHCVPRAGL